jgi:probable F420-dependent oxidoreductase
MSPSNYWRWINYCEKSGIDSIWHSDQLLGASLEPLATLAALAGRTSRMTFGTNALVVPFREPLVVAKQLATIAFLSGGRMFPVLGVGDVSDSYWAATGEDARSRGRRADEAITLIRQLLTKDEVSFEGEHFGYHGAGIQPRPKKLIPLWIGGHSEPAIRRVATMGDGWLGGPMHVDKARATKLRIITALAETGRQIEHDHFAITVPLRIGAANDASVVAARGRFMKLNSHAKRIKIDDPFVVGTADFIIELLKNYVVAGISKFVVLPIANGPEDLMSQTRLLVQQIIPSVQGKA